MPPLLDLAIRCFETGVVSLRFLDILLGLLFPVSNFCLACGKDTDMYCLCPDCRKLVSTRLMFKSCKLCGRYAINSSPNDEQSFLCHECQEKSPLFSLARSVGPYGGVLKDMVYLFKYEGHSSLAEVFGMLMAEVFLNHAEFASTDMLVPVPLSQEKFLSRGYNQSALLAQKMGWILGLPAHECLRRIKDSSSQSRLSRLERERNIIGAFSLCGDVRNKKTVLIDDVLTTGATASECALVLLKGGASNVSVLSLASGIQEK